MSMLSWNEFVLRLGAAVLAGALIGFERQWRSRGAGLRTNTLVAAGAAMFVLISHMTPSGSNPSQVTAYVVSGVGFLGAGVIISDGVSVRGINTAAILAINVVLRPLGRRVDRQPHNENTEIETIYRFRATTRDKKKRTSARSYYRASPATATSSAPWRAPTSTAPTKSKSEPSSPPSAATTSRSKQPPAGSDSNPTSRRSGGM